jgi:Domain of unknown function (DUF2019)
MSADNYATMNIAQLVEKFIDLAKRTHVATGLLDIVDSVKTGGALQDQSWQSACLEAAAEIRSLVAVLQDRMPTGQAELWFEDADVDVRLSAALFFSDADPEMANPAISSVYERMSTREMLTLKRRALEPPPARPTFQEMSEDALVARFEDAATREYATRFLESVQEFQDMTERNRILVELWNLMRELKGRDALGLLLPLLAHANVTVRREAATACLRVAEQASIAALEKIIATAGYDDSVPAQDALESWREKGRAVYGV